MKDQLQKLLEGVYRNEIFFDEFYSKAKDLGLDSLETDFGLSQHKFRLKNGEIFSYPFPNSWVFKVPTSFSQELLLKAIKAIDEKHISARDFYFKTAESGVSVAFVYTEKPRIIYLGRDGEFYIEEW